MLKYFPSIPTLCVLIINGYCILSNVLASIDMIEDMGQNRTRVALYFFPGDCGYLTAATTLYTVSPFLSLGSASVCTSYSGPLVCWLQVATQPSTTTEFSEAQRVLDCFCCSPLSFPLPDSPACSSTPLSDVQCTDLSDLFVVLSRESLIVPLGTLRGKTKRFPHSDMMLMSLPNFCSKSYIIHKVKVLLWLNYFFWISYNWSSNLI